MMVCSKTILLVALVSIGSATALPENITRGGIFDGSNTQVSKRDTSFHKEELTVSTILNAPFFMIKEGTEAHYEGYCVDLLKSLAKMAKFKYTIRLVSDGKYGQYSESKQHWSGMIGELESQKADLAVADLVITSERARVVDFTMPFMNTGITLLYKREPYGYNRGLFTLFVSPFEIYVWLCILAAYFTVSFVLFIIARFNAIEKENAEESCSTRNENVVQSANGKEAFTVLNSFWFILASGLAQRVDFIPRAFSTRLIAACWWFFVIITISSYIANLVAFLNFETPPAETERIQDSMDLAEQNRVKYGTIQGGTTEAFFRGSKFSIHDRMWFNMNNNGDVFVQSAKEGIEKVLQEDGKYAFFTESTVVDYVVGRNCNLKQVGGLIDSKSYGIGLPKNSPYYDRINSAVLKLQEDGVLKQLKMKWWYDGEVCKRMNPLEHRGPVSLDIHDLGGLFVILLVGIILACVIACGECLFVWWKKRQTHQA